MLINIGKNTIYFLANFINYLLPNIIYIFIVSNGKKYIYENYKHTFFILFTLYVLLSSATNSAVRFYGLSIPIYLSVLTLLVHMIGLLFLKKLYIHIRMFELMSFVFIFERLFLIALEIPVIVIFRYFDLLKPEYVYMDNMIATVFYISCYFLVLLLLRKKVEYAKAIYQLILKFSPILSSLFVISTLFISYSLFQNFQMYAEKLENIEVGVLTPEYPIIAISCSYIMIIIGIELSNHKKSKIYKLDCIQYYNKKIDSLYNMLRIYKHDLDNIIAASKIYGDESLEKMINFYNEYNEEIRVDMDEIKLLEQLMTINETLLKGRIMMDYDRAKAHGIILSINCIQCPIVNKNCVIDLAKYIQEAVSFSIKENAMEVKVSINQLQEKQILEVEIYDRMGNPIPYHISIPNKKDSRIIRQIIINSPHLYVDEMINPQVVIIE